MVATTDTAYDATGATYHRQPRPVDGRAQGRGRMPSGLYAEWSESPERRAAWNVFVAAWAAANADDCDAYAAACDAYDTARDKWMAEHEEGT